MSKAAHDILILPINLLIYKIHISKAL
jgi:hypothetical protein